MYAESAPVRKSARSATSSGRPIRPSGTSLRYSSAVAAGSTPSGLLMGVSIAPGQTAFTRTPFAASSSAATRVSPRTACLEAA